MTTPKLTAVSIPLAMDASITGKSMGIVTSLTATTLKSTGAGWVSGQLSNPQIPYLIRITKGSATGRTFLVSASSINTTDTLTIDSSEMVDLTTLGLSVNSDTFEIIPAETLANLLTPVENGVLGGSSSSTADCIQINKNGVWSTYFYSTSTSPNRWTKVAFGSPDASNEVIRPDAVILYQRRGSTAISLPITGIVPKVKRASVVKTSGLTFLSSNWPTENSLSALKLNSLTGWVSNTSSSSADRVQILATDGTWKTYFHDGTNWRRVAFGSPLANTDPVYSATGVLLDRRGTSTTTTIYSDNLPYAL
jgi:hypothetical protein